MNYVSWLLKLCIAEINWKIKLHIHLKNVYFSHVYGWGCFTVYLLFWQKYIVFKAHVLFYLFVLDFLYVSFCVLNIMLRPFWCAVAFECELKIVKRNFFFVAIPLPPAITPNHASMNPLLWIPVRRKNYSLGRVTSKLFRWKR